MAAPFATYAPAIGQAALGLYQLSQKVKRQDTTTAAERENLDLARQATAAQLPGYGQQVNDLTRLQNATLQSATLGASSPADLLAASVAANQQQQRGLNLLGQRYDQYRAGAMQRLQAALAQKGAHELRDTERALQGNAQLQGAGIQNLSGALDKGASVAAYDAAGGFDKSTRPAIGSAADYVGVGDYPSSPYSNPYLRRRSGSLYAGYIG